jgi:hypothetical protein
MSLNVSQKGFIIAFYFEIHYIIKRAISMYIHCLVLIVKALLRSGLSAIILSEDIIIYYYGLWLNSIIDIQI